MLSSLSKFKMSSESNNKEQSLEGTNDKTKTTRHPRWTRDETIVLIQGKRIVENRIQNNRISNSPNGFDHSEPKWDAVASYCKQHGVNRSSVQCRKRWGNLLVDFKKIRAWESRINEKAESYWVMRNELRKEMKLPGFFDKEVYEELDREVYVVPAVPLTLARRKEDEENGVGYEIVVMGEEEREEEEDVADGEFNKNENRIGGAGGGFSDHVQLGQEETEKNPEKETALRESPTKGVGVTPLHISDEEKKRFQSPNAGTEWTSQERWKKRRLSLNTDDVTSAEERLIKVLEKNNSMLSAQLEAQNMNHQLDRDQRKEHTDSLISAIGKIADALVQIANKP